MARNRLALSHNYLQTFPARFSECTSLRYLNVRQNRIKEFPLAVSVGRLRRPGIDRS
jgi:Leucine-rich repeat (LRR) protein